MNRLFRPVDIASLVFFRIVFGILGFADVLSTFIYYHLMKDAFNPEKFQFRYYGFEWVKPLPEPFMSVILLVICGLGLLVAFGKWYRFSSWAFAAGFAYTFLLEKAHYLNHGYLFCWIAFVMCFLPAHRQFSADVLKRPVLKSDTIPYWCLFLLQFLMGVVYFYGGIAKINEDWLNAIPLKQWLGYRSSLPVIGLLLEQDWMAYFMAYGGLLLDLTVVFFLMVRKTRPWAFTAVIFFHLMNLLIFNIGIFPFLSLALTALYFSPSFPRFLYRHLEGRLRFLWRVKEWWKERTSLKPRLRAGVWQEKPAFKLPVTVGISLIVLFHLLVPLRHHLFPGDVTWTEEGHRYSWRMMLRSKQGSGHFIIRDKKTGEEEVVRPRELLGDKQVRKILTHPDMILQFAHYLQDKYKKEEGREVEVYADVRVRLNFRDYTLYIDPSVNLAKEEWKFFKPSKWIIPEKR